VLKSGARGEAEATDRTRARVRAYERAHARRDRRKFGVLCDRSFRKYLWIGARWVLHCRDAVP